MRLSEKQMKILDFIIDYSRVNRCSPSLEEIAKGAEYQSTGGLSYQLKKLRAIRLLEWDPNHPRTIRVLTSSYEPRRAKRTTASNQDVVLAPVLGDISAGTPRTAEQNAAFAVRLPQLPVGQGDMFLHRMTDDSMLDAAISDGDWVVVRQQDDARDGQTVVARIAGEDTVRLLRYRGERRWLEPCHSGYERTSGEEASVLGVVVAVLQSVAPSRERG